MPDTGETITLRTIERIGDLRADDWDACAGDGNPFVTHTFLKALEDSQSVSGRTGWLPQHLIAEDRKGRIIGCVPMYLKSHSYGEYVFDHGWAEAFARAGGRYYPKLQIAVPFTPVPGPRLLARGDAAPAIRAALARGLIDVARRRNASSIHATFCAPADIEAFRAAGYLIRAGFQYHWENRGYESFDAFLATLSHGKRKAIRKERREVAAAGVRLVVLRGEALREEHWDAFFTFYEATADAKWGNPYLTRAFFSRLQATMRERVVLMLVEHDGNWVAGALNLVGSDTLYGRNWGAIAAFKHLHFETCYYQALEYAIAHRLARVEAGAQGEHKLQRGYLPTRTFSAHWLAERGFQRAVADFLGRETAQIDRVVDELMQHSPYKQADT